MTNIFDNLKRYAKKGERLLMLFTVLIKNIPTIDDYLRTRLEDSFAQHHNFYNKTEDIRKQQYV